MKKALQTILIVMMSLLALVSCSQETAISDQLVSATLISTDRVSKALETEVDFDLSAVKLWKYTARKANGGLTTGQTELGADKAATLKSDGTTEGLSQGAWNFVLYGYDATTGGNLIAQGSINNATVTTENNEVTITVYPLQTEGAKGKIAVASDISIISADGKTAYSAGSQGYTMSYKVYKSDDTNMDTDLADADSLDVGSYKVVVSIKGTVNDEEYEAATGNKTVNVYAGLTTTVKGTIQESTQNATLSRKSGVYTDTATKSKVSSDTVAAAITMTANASPVGTEKTTSVKFPANSLTLNSSELNFTVVASPVETVTATYTVENSGSAVAGFDLTLEGATISESLTGDNSIEITTTIASGLVKDNLRIKYVGDSEDNTASIKTYDSSTGALTFIVYHFSEYVITTTENVAYDEDSLRNVIQKASTGETATEIKIIDDISLVGTLLINEAKKIKIDLNNHNISSTEAINIFEIFNGHLELAGTGTIKGTENSTKTGIYLRGSSTDQEKFSTAKIGSNVTLSAYYGISIVYDNTVDLKTVGYHAYGVEVTMNGEYIGATKTQYTDCLITVNGSIQDTEGNVPKITIENATVEKGNIYAAGYAEWTIKNTNMSSTGTLIGLKAGKFEIDGGTYSTTGTFAEPSLDSGNGSVSTGAAVSITSNKSYTDKINVVIKSGTFTSANGYAVYEGIPNSTSTGQAVSDKSFAMLSIEGGTFKGAEGKLAVKLNTIENKKVIKGGTFNSNPAQVKISDTETVSYLVDDYSATESDGTWTVTQNVQ